MKVYVVHGPPLSGKTTYVQERKGPNDLIYDFDVIMAAISGLQMYQRNQNLMRYVLDIRDLILARLRRERYLDNAWIITTKVTSYLRQALIGLDVEYIKLDVDIKTVKERLHQNPDGRDIKHWSAAIDKYFASYEGKQRHRKFYKSKDWKHKRKQILERDNHECQWCKAKGEYSKANTVHHIKSLDEHPGLALADDNLISLCEACHNRAHPEKFRDAEVIRREKKHIIEERW